MAYGGSHKAFCPLVQSRYLDEIDRGLLGEFISRRKQAGTMDTTICGNLAFPKLAVRDGDALGMAGHKSGHGSQQESPQGISASDPISYLRRG